MIFGELWWAKQSKSLKMKNNENNPLNKCITPESNCSNVLKLMSQFSDLHTFGNFKRMYKLMNTSNCFPDIFLKKSSRLLLCEKKKKNLRQRNPAKTTVWWLSTIRFCTFPSKCFTVSLCRVCNVNKAVWKGGNAYLGILRSSARTQMANVRRATEPDWWVAASGVGTYSKSVLMPRATWRAQKQFYSTPKDVWIHK